MRQTGDPVANQFPSIPPPGTARIAIVGECPGRDEDHWGTPFIGESGRILDSALGHVGISRAQCFAGNICQHRPPGESNDFSRFEWMEPAVQHGITQLRMDLEEFQPTVVLCLGNAALHLFKHGNQAPPKRGGQFDWPSRIGNWRGSLFESTWLTGWLPEKLSTGRGEIATNVHFGCKCLATFHPAAVSRDYSLQAYYHCWPGIGDLDRLVVESRTRELVLPQRRILCCGDADFLLPLGLEALERMRLERLPVSVDIEGTPENITSIAFSRRPDVAIVFPLAHLDFRRRWSKEEEAAIWQAARLLLEDPSVVKIGQNFAYDAFCLRWFKDIRVCSPVQDTMEAWWELFAELDKSLAVQASLLTKQPFYKPDREEGELQFDSDEQFWRYNGMDAAVTYEVWQREMELMRQGQREHFQFNCELFEAKLYMMMRGIRVDEEALELELEKARRGVWELQALIDHEQAKLLGPGTTTLYGLHANFADGRCSEEWFAWLCLSCLGGKNPRQRVEVVEERWQPVRWNGKKWVRHGKLCRSESGIAFRNIDLPVDPPVGLIGYEARPRKISRLQPVIPQALEDVDPHVLDSKRAEWKRVRQIWKELKDEQTKRGNDGENVDTGELRGRSHLLGELSTLLGLHVNAGSTSEGGAAQVFLFETCGLPFIYKDQRTGRYSREAEAEWRKRTKEGALSHDHRRDQAAGEIPRGADETPPEGDGDVEKRAARSRVAGGKRPSTDQQALDLLYSITQDLRVLWVLQQRRLRMVVSDLEKPRDKDGRIRSSLSFVKETGRMAASKSPLGTGTNLQALNKDLLHVLAADEGFEMGKFDLEGADSWTVAAECAALGDRTMLDDLRAGLKPAKVLCFMHLFGAEEVNSWERKVIRGTITLMPPWLYPAAKACIHGSSYGMGWMTMRDTILKNSMADLPLDLKDSKPIVLAKQQIEKLQGAVFSRYPGLKAWHAKEGRSLMDKGYIETSAGHVRRFYGRKSEWSKGRKQPCHETLKEALASKPQFWTTHVSKKALWKLWHDPENQGPRRIEPLMARHDELLVQWRVADRDWALQKMKGCFDVEVEIAGEKICIPVDCKVGRNWGMK